MGTAAQGGEVGGRGEGGVLHHLEILQRVSACKQLAVWFIMVHIHWWVRFGPSTPQPGSEVVE